MTEEDLNAIICGNLKRFREKSGYTLESFAKLMGLASKQHQGMMETGKQKISAEYLVRASRALGVELSEFFKKDGVEVWLINKSKGNDNEDS